MRYQCRVIIYSLTEGNNNIDTLSLTHPPATLMIVLRPSYD